MEKKKNTENKSSYTDQNNKIKNSNNNPSLKGKSKGSSSREIPSKGGKNNKPKPKDMLKCDMCKQPGHSTKWCPNKKRFLHTKCSICWGIGHPQSACPNYQKGTS